MISSTSTDRCFESRISSGATEKLSGSGNTSTNVKAWRKNSFDGTASWQSNTSSRYKVPTPCSDHHQFKMEEPGNCGRIEKRLLSNFLKCSCWAPIGRPDIPWSLNNVARAVTKCTRPVADARPVSFLTFVTLLKIVDWDCFNTVILPQILKTLHVG